MVTFRLRSPKRSASLELNRDGAARLRFGQKYGKTSVEVGITENATPRFLMTSSLGKVVHKVP